MEEKKEQENILKIISTLKKQDYKLPLAEAIKNKNPFFILVSTILSARTKDSLTEKVCKNLFKKIKNVKDLQKIKLKELEELIRPVNYYKTKARHLKELHIKKVPNTLEELIELPGVGRKTANIVLNTAFSIPAIAVDTHVHRISNRLGYVKTRNPKETEYALMKKLPLKYWSVYNKLLVMHGQNTCLPINPKCDTCPISKYCNKIGVIKHR